MLSERIFFIIERISDILSVDQGRNEILRLCEEASDDERKTFLELYSDAGKWGWLKRSPDDKIREILELYWDDERKELLNLYLDYKIREILNADKVEFLLDKYNDGWREKTLKYLDLRKRWFQYGSPGTFYEVINFLMGHEEGKQVTLSIDVKNGIGELQKELSLIYGYLRDVEAKYYDRRVSSENEVQFYLNLSYIAHSSDDILDHVTSYDVFARDIYDLVTRIQNSYNFQPTYILNTNFYDGQQIIGPTTISLSPSHIIRDSRPKSYGHYPNPHLVGFKHEIETLLNHLLHPHDETFVVGIVGMGGSGKTTLAKHIYHHPTISTHFHRKVWVCISQSWNKTTILNSIWRQASQNPNALEMGYDQVVELLYTFLSSKTYLVILDDIWSIDAWYDISPAFLHGRGSQIVATTRNRTLPIHIDPKVLIVEPKQLNDEESYELFRMTCLPNDSIPLNLMIEMGKEMVKKCKGLPLAIHALSGILKMGKSPSSWKNINKTLMSNILKIGNDSTQGVVKEVLALSYHELPHHLKPCVLYLRVFPEDYVIEARQLIHLWMAECLVDDESVAETYIQEMAQRSIVQIVNTNYKGQVRKFQIHDLIRQILVDMNEERGLLKDSLRLVSRATLYDDEQKSYDSHMEVMQRHLYRSSLDISISHARSLISFNYVDCCNLKLQQLFMKFRLLRVLILCQISVTELPDAIGNLIHLRYLKLSGNSCHLPGSIGNLKNLRTIDIENLYTSKVPIITTLVKLKELRHLYLPRISLDYAIEKEMKVSRLEKLRTLWGARGGEWMLRGMPNLNAVLQELCVVNIQTLEQLMAGFTTPSLTSNNLRILKLMWDCELSDMSMLSECKSLTKLKLGGQIGKNTHIVFPPSLIKLEVENTCLYERELLNIISKSCPHLRILALKERSYMGSELVTNANSFPELEKLTLEFLSIIKLWIIEESAMPRLQHLTIRGCKNMNLNLEGRTIISRIPHLKFEDLSPTFEENMNLNLEGRTLISRIPHLEFEDLSPTVEENMNLNLESMDSSPSTRISTLFHYDVIRITIVVICCCLFYQMYF